MRLRATANPTTTPVTLAEAKADLYVIHALDDARIQIALDAAHAHLGGIDGTTGRAIAKQAFETALDAFPVGALALPLPPLVSVESVTYVDLAGVTQTLAPAGYTVDVTAEPGAVSPVSTWPQTKDVRNAVRVQFTAGYDTAPSALRAAILLMVRDLYNNEPGKHDATIDRLVFPLRMIRP